MENKKNFWWNEHWLLKSKVLKNSSENREKYAEFKKPIYYINWKGLPLLHTLPKPENTCPLQADFELWELVRDKKNKRTGLPLNSIIDEKTQVRLPYRFLQIFLTEWQVTWIWKINKTVQIWIFTQFCCALLRRKSKHKE